MNTTEGQTQQSQLISTIYQFYRDNFWLFWRVMGPLIFLIFLVDIVILYGFYHNDTNTLWTVSTSSGFSVTRFFQTGTGLKITTTFSSFIYIFLCFVMFPLVFAIFQIHLGTNVASRSVWRLHRS